MNNIPIHDRNSGHSPQIQMPHNTLTGIATYSKGATKDASAFRYAKDEEKDRKRTVAAQINRKTNSAKDGTAVGLNKKSADLLAESFQSPNTLYNSNGNADIR